MKYDAIQLQQNFVCSRKTCTVWRLGSVLLQDPSDNVTVTIEPLSHRDYEYHIISHHPSGIFWYHPHWHGSTAFQVKHLIYFMHFFGFFFIHCETINIFAWVLYWRLFFLCKNTIVEVIAQSKDKQLLSNH